jgi:hypothetical protein
VKSRGIQVGEREDLELARPMAVHLATENLASKKPTSLPVSTSTIGSRRPAFVFLRVNAET